MSNSQVIPESIPDSPQTGNDGEVSAVVSNVRPVKIQIPVAVFTAYRGYDWSKLPDFVSRDEADSLFEKIMSVKTNYCDDFLPYDDAFKGVLYEGKYAFAFRLMTAERWDQAKRDSYYCACAFIPQDKLMDVDFERLLDMDYFKTPTHTPDCLLEYSDEDFLCPSTDECSLMVWNFKLGDKKEFDWRFVGPILSDFGYANNKWFFARISSRGESKVITEFGNWDESKFDDPSANEVEQQKTESQDYKLHRNIEAPQDDVSINEELIETKRELENLRIQNDRIKSSLAIEQQERSAAQATVRKYEQYYHAYIALRDGTPQKKSLPNLLLLAGAFLLGVLLSCVAFLTFQLWMNHASLAKSHDRKAHKAIQSVEVPE